MRWKKVLVFAILFAFGVFLLQNTNAVQVRFFFWKAEAPRALVLVISFATGLAVGALLAWQRRGKGRDLQSNVR